MKEMNYIDLGLPSGTKWAEQNEKEYCSLFDALTMFGPSIPASDQFDELLSLPHHWDNERRGIEFLGNNGNKLFLPVFSKSAGFGKYWSRHGYFYFTSYVCQNIDRPCSEYLNESIRLVQR